MPGRDRQLAKKSMPIAIAQNVAEVIDPRKFRFMPLPSGILSIGLVPTELLAFEFVGNATSCLADAFKQRLLVALSTLSQCHPCGR